MKDIKRKLRTPTHWRYTDAEPFSQIGQEVRLGPWPELILIRRIRLTTAFIVHSSPAAAQGRGDCGAFLQPARCNISTLNQSLEGRGLLREELSSGRQPFL